MVQREREKKITYNRKLIINSISGLKNATSSSEDGAPLVFAEARRSKRYMSKRTSGTFRDYLKSRSIEFADGEGTSNNDDSLEHECMNNNSANKCHETFKRNGSARGSYSSIINSMHGIVQNELKCNGSSVDESKGTSNDDDEDVFIATKSKSGKTASNSSFLKKYDTEAMAKAQFESTDDWYASASDMDDSDSALSKPYGYNAVNPVLECVNQVSAFAKYLLHPSNSLAIVYFRISNSYFYFRFYCNNPWMAYWTQF